jgi:hypothetical protein
VEAVWRGLEAIYAIYRGHFYRGHFISSRPAITKTGDPDSKTKAAGLINTIVNIDFICGIMFLKNVMYKTFEITCRLSSRIVDIASALIAMESTYVCGESEWLTKISTTKY